MKKLDSSKIDENIGLYFFDPNKDKDNFIEEYKKIKQDRYLEEKGYRYSPLFLILKDIRYCFGCRKQFNHIPKEQKDPANFAGIILIHAAFDNLVKKFYSGNYPGFAKKFMGITNSSEVKALDYLRNGLVHNNYGLSYYVDDTKYYFFLGIGLNKLIEETKLNTTYKSKGYIIDVRKLMSSFENGVREYREFLLNHNNPKARKMFFDSYDEGTWVFIKDTSIIKEDSKL